MLEKGYGRNGTLPVETLDEDIGVLWNGNVET